MRDVFSFWIKLEKKEKAREKACQDPRVLELKAKIAELKKQEEELEDKLTDEIYKQMIAGS